MPTAAISPATAKSAAVTSAPRGKPSKSTAAPTITPVSATAIRPAIREIALLTADPMPLCAGSTAASTAAVSGETVIVSPRPNTTSPGINWVQMSTGGWAADIHRKPAAATIGPTAMNNRGPCTPARVPNRRASRNDSTGIGRVTRPARVADSPRVSWRNSATINMPSDTPA
ncbi:hypothetical protein A5698_26300 [Mycobacterium sp. E136]|nr:hypothetical protein A5698_26300 [Mycobacterium sp. E136]